MMYIVSYDICDNNSRSLLNKFLKENGLCSIQKSIFFGELSLNGKKQLIEESKSYFNNKKDSLLFISLCSDDFSKYLKCGVGLNLLVLKKEEVEFL
ncbi:MAG: CRISPR-associated endonuclease Cas2 [Cetobacterium sp.]